MFELLAAILFIWLLFGAVRLALKVTWGAAKLIATLLFLLALPLFLVCILFAGGVILMIPVALVVAAWGILKRSI